MLEIRHPEFGAIRSIDTKGLEYTSTMTDGRIQKVDAEERPGLVHERKQPVADWRISVETAPA
jgi:hypothetical protein